MNVDRKFIVTPMCYYKLPIYLLQMITTINRENHRYKLDKKLSFKENILKLNTVEPRWYEHG